MKAYSPKLPLTLEERSELKAAKIKLNQIANMDISALSNYLETVERAKQLRALAEFQTIPSIGPIMAQGVIDLGYYSLEEIKNQNGAELLNRLEEHYGCWQDPCVEDWLRCVVLSTTPIILTAIKPGGASQRNGKGTANNMDTPNHAQPFPGIKSKVPGTIHNLGKYRTRNF